jgi:hypothetical protein
MNGITPERDWPAEWRGRPNPLREAWLNREEVAAAEVNAVRRPAHRRGRMRDVALSSIYRQNTLFSGSWRRINLGVTHDLLVGGRLPSKTRCIRAYATSICWKCLCREGDFGFIDLISSRALRSRGVSRPVGKWSRQLVTARPASVPAISGGGKMALNSSAPMPRRRCGVQGYSREALDATRAEAPPGSARARTAGGAQERAPGRSFLRGRGMGRLRQSRGGSSGGRGRSKAIINSLEGRGQGRAEADETLKRTNTVGPLLHSTHSIAGISRVGVGRTHQNE